MKLRKKLYIYLISAILALSFESFAQENSVDYRNLINVGIELGWLMDMDKYDTLGQIDTYLPVYQFSGDGAVYLDIDQRVPFNNISGTTRFVVPETNYAIEAGLSKRLGTDNIGSVFYRRQGRAELDNTGALHLNLIGVSVFSEDYLVRDISPGLKWKLSLSGSFDNNNTRGGVLFESGFIYNLCSNDSIGLGVEGELGTLITSKGTEAVLEIGPKLSFYGPNGTINSIVAKYIADHTAFSIEDSGFFLGVAVEKGAPFTGKSCDKLRFMDYGGTLAFGFGESGRVITIVDLLGNIPGVSEGYDNLYFAYEAQSFYLTGSDTNLYYVTIAGLEKEWNDYAVGFYFNHRSGHLINSSNEFEKDDLNLYEIGICSPGWHLYRRKNEALTFGVIPNVGRFNFFARAGTNADNTFVSRWHIDTKFGFRIDLDRRILNLEPFISNYDEIIGNALLHDTTIGLRNTNGWSYNLKYHYDDQIADTDNGALLLTIGKIF